MSVGTTHLSPRTVLVATPRAETAAFLASLVTEEGWALGLPHSPASLREIIGRGDLDLAIVDQSWLDDEVLTLLKNTGPNDTGTHFVVVLDSADELDCLAWMNRGAAAFLHEPVHTAPAETTLFVLRSIFRTLHLPRGFADEVRVRQTTGRWIEFDAPSHQGALEQFQRFFAVLHAAKLTEEEKRMLHLAFNEIGMNAIEWGNRQNPERRVRIAYAFLPDRICVRIEDEGSGFEPAEIPDPTTDPTGVIAQRTAAGKRLGGYGLALVRNVMDKVEFENNGSIVIMERRLKLSGRLLPVEPAPTPDAPAT